MCLYSFIRIGYDCSMKCWIERMKEKIESVGCWRYFFLLPSWHARWSAANGGTTERDRAVRWKMCVHTNIENRRESTQCQCSRWKIVFLSLFFVAPFQRRYMSFHSTQHRHSKRLHTILCENMYNSCAEILYERIENESGKAKHDKRTWPVCISYNATKWI